MTHTAIKGATEHRVAPNIHIFLNAVIGVIVADVQQTIKSEQLKAKIKKFGTIWRLL